MNFVLRAVVVLSMAAAANCAAEAKTLYGFARDYGKCGLVTIDTAAPTEATIISSNVQPTAGAIVGETMYLFALDDDFNNQLYTVDLTTGVTEKIAQRAEQFGSPMDMSYNYADDKMYFVCNSDNENVATSRLGSINLSDGKFTSVKSDLGFFVRAMAISHDGVMYYMTRDGVLCTYVIATGEKRTIGASGVIPRETFSSLGFDRTDGSLYWAVQPKGTYINRLYQIDVETGAATELGIINASVNNGEGHWTLALDFPFVASAPSAPEHVEDLAAEADENGQRRVTLTWINPSQKTNQDALDRIDSVVVYRDETLVGGRCL